jgi:hypothetical protein
MRERNTYTELVLAMDATGPSAFRRTYTAARSQEAFGEDRPEVKVSSVQGKTVTVKRAGGKVTVTAAKGKLSAEDLRELRDELDPKKPKDPDFFPEREVSVGDEWDVDPKLLTQSLEGSERAAAKMKFVEVIEYAGHRCARFEVSVEVEGAFGTGEQKVPMTMGLSGETYYAIALERFLHTRVAGPVTFRGEIVQNGVAVTMEGVGTMQMTETNRWIKVAGKPVGATRK